MDLRVMIKNKRVQETINKVSKSERRFLVEEAILYYEKALRTNAELQSLVLEIEKDVN